MNADYYATDSDYSTDDEIFEPKYVVEILLLKTPKFAVINSIDWVPIQ